MQVLLLKDVEGIGRAGDIKEVAGGFALNYLIPRKLGVQATEGAQKQAKLLKDAAERRRDRKSTEAKVLAARVDGKTLTFKARAGDGDRLYGSITSADIAEALSKQIGTEVDRRFIELEHPIKSLGEHKVAIKLGGGANAAIYVLVERAAEAV